MRPLLRLARWIDELQIHCITKAKKMTMSGFSEFNLSPPVFQAVQDQGFQVPTEIQSQTIPLILDGGDVVGQANTGTGKTAAFALPLLCRVDPSVRKPQVLVLAPTRELAIQVSEAFSDFARNTPELKVATIYGGQSYGIQISALKNGSQIVVGTPGRVIDHMKRGNLVLDKLSAFVLDEADEMLKMGFADDVQWILGSAPKNRQTLLFSATMPERLRKIAEKYLTDPSHISTSAKTMTTSTVKQRVCEVEPRGKMWLLGRILEAEETEGVIVFVKTKEMSSRLAEGLCQKGLRASMLNGDMAQQQRERTVERLKSGKLDILVATDVAARGLDVDRISHVINYDFPHDTEAYVHRIGRTGRAGREGTAILFACSRERRQLRRLEKVTGQPLTSMEPPTNESIQAARGKRLKLQLSKRMAERKAPAEFALTVLKEFLEENPALTMEEVAAELAVLAMGGSDGVDDSYGQGKRREKKSRNRRHEGENGDRRNRGERGGSGRDKSRPHGGENGSSDRKRDRSGKRQAGSMTKYRIEVGHAHGVRPANIVGAITSESELTGSEIGGIDIQNDFSTVDLPVGLPYKVIDELKQLRVVGRALRISKCAGSSRFNGKHEKPGNFKKAKKKSSLKGKAKKKPAKRLKKRVRIKTAK